MDFGPCTLYNAEQLDLEGKGGSCCCIIPVNKGPVCNSSDREGLPFSSPRFRPGDSHVEIRDRNQSILL